MPRRRLLLQAGAALASAGLPSAWAHTSTGSVKPPQPVPELGITLHTGQSARLASLLRGRATALQLMFTGCSAICPIQGALFAQVQAGLPAARNDLQLLSASIDPLGDDAKALSGWLARYGAGPRWRAFAPAVAGLDPWLDFLNGRATGADRHTGQVYFFDRQARLVLRTVDFPKPQDVARLLEQLGAQGPA